MNNRDSRVICPHCSKDFGEMDDRLGFMWEDEETGEEFELRAIEPNGVYHIATCTKCKKDFKMVCRNVTFVDISKIEREGE